MAWERHSQDKLVVYINGYFTLMKAVDTLQLFVLKLSPRLV